MPVPEVLSSFRLYKDGTDYLGVADVELPSLEWLTETVGGAGVAGEVESPVVGHFKSLSLKVKWRVLTQNVASLAASKAHHLEARGSIQRFDAGAGEYKSYAVKCLTKAIPKKIGLGKLEMGKKQDNDLEFECVYLKLWIEDNEVIEIDKYNFICMIDGTDYLAEVRTHLGLG